ncbi:MAG: hypothetical protein LBS91_05355 [Clostridiales Family XIII bacterium]|jgi:X-X-X-Leu-X-X-Gly heptad repeat protein|nr:hypothetical protein [Clostridiales Family XIII bacterium]
MKAMKKRMLVSAALVIAVAASCWGAAWASGNSTGGAGSGGAAADGIAGVSAADAGVARQAGIAAAGMSGAQPKEEVVYAKLATDGAPQEAYVVNIVNVEKAGIVTDYGDYSSLKNLTSDSKIESGVDGAIVFDAPPGDFYYQGNIASPSLPWLFKLTYRLDGEEARADALAGGGGRLAVSIETRKNEALDSGWFDNCLLQISVTLDAALCKNIKADGGMVANAGSSKLVTFAVMPGKEGALSLEADVVDFSMPGIQFSAVPLAMAFERPNTSEMTDDMAKLADAIAKLDDGVRELADGARDISDGVSAYSDGAWQFAGGLDTLAAKADSLKQGAAGIGESLARISEGLSGFAAPGIPQLAVPAGLTETEAAAAVGYVYAAGDTELAGKLGAFFTELGALQAQFAGLQEQLGALQEQLAMLETLAQGITALAGAYNDPDPEKGFASGLNAYLDGVKQTAPAAARLAGGADGLETGLAEFKDGVVELKGGTAKLQQETRDMPEQIEEKIDELIGEFDKSGYAPLSFASAKNGEIGAVQFVITTGKIEKPGKPADDTAADSNRSMLDRLADLFRKE